MQIDCAATGILRARCYIVSGSYQDEEFVLIIDPGGSYNKIKSLITKPVTHIILTHTHFDHIGAVNELHKEFPDAKICLGEYEDTNKESILAVMKESLGIYFDRLNTDDTIYNLPKPDILLKDGDELCGFRVIHTPGHTKGSICIYNDTEKILFSGDTLFANGYGRTDLNGNEYDLVQSLEKLMTLNSDTIVYPGHNENTTIGIEKANLRY